MMRRLISSKRRNPVSPPIPLPCLPQKLSLAVDAPTLRCQVTPVVSAGQAVKAGSLLAEGLHSSVHSPLDGKVEKVDERYIQVAVNPEQEPHHFEPPPAPDRDSLPAFAAETGLHGMGGSMFPASVKLQSCARIRTLVINAVECEPGIEIDESLLIYETATVKAGVSLIAAILRPDEVVLAVKKSAAGRIHEAARSMAGRMLVMPDTYPAGAERLIAGKLSGKYWPAGNIPSQNGYLVFSVASLWATGRRITLGQPSIHRPLTICPESGPPVNIIAPIGTPVSHLLDVLRIPFHPEKQIIAAGGLMMGRQAYPGWPVSKGTNALFVVTVSERMLKEEGPCIRCGACFDACPLGLHPSAMADLIRSGCRTDRRLPAFARECFLCGACAAACPANIPLVDYFRKGKSWN